MARFLLLLALLAAAGRALAAPAVAFFYGPEPPWDELAAFDWAVLEPGHGFKPQAVNGGRTALFAYVSVGEVSPDRAYLKDIPQEWRAGVNLAWNSVVVDQAAPGWADFFVERVITPLWQAGWRGFFLDTLDSYHLVAETPEAKARQEAGLVKVVEALARRYPEAKLIANRGFEILPRVTGRLAGIAGESLYRGWDPEKKQYREVPAADREWLAGQLARARDKFKLAAIAIDYLPAKDRQGARETARRIAADGFIPWVATPELDHLGVGAVEVLPRKVLVLVNRADDYNLRYHEALRYLAMPLNWLGYVPDYLDLATDPLPEAPLTGRYAGVVSWFLPGEKLNASRYLAWFRKQVDAGVRLAVMEDFGFPLTPQSVEGLSLRVRNAVASGQVKLATVKPPAGFEIRPAPQRKAFLPLRVDGGEPLLTLVDARGEAMDAIAYTPWGGYALNPYAVDVLPGNVGQRWVIEPFEFLRRALALPDMPVPDVSTENGLRLLMAHVDGDGFPSRAEMPGTPFAAEVMLTELLERYRIPTTVSVIEAEVAPGGLYPKLSPELEKIARRIFALPHVEIASHSYSHPFKWRKAEASSPGEGYSLSIPGYSFDAGREVNGSLDYINRVLAPPGKRARMFLWTGDCNPGPDTVAMTRAAGVGNMNGGDTLITRSAPSLTLVSPLGMPKGETYQVFAPNQNENVYTNNWTGPFYGYERAIETFELTGAPRRLKPVDIYYHTYSASKPASLGALKKVYQWALAQPSFPVHASGYVERVLGFRSMAVAREGDGFRVRGGGAVRTLRIPAAAGWPDLAASAGLAGHADHGAERYLHMSGDEARVKLAPAPSPGPWLAEANGTLADRVATPGALDLKLESPLPLAFALGGAAGCKVSVDGVPAAPRSMKDGLARFEAGRHGLHAIQVRCPR